MKYYLAGPMTGIKDYNFPAFEEAVKAIRLWGYDVISAHEVDHGETLLNRGATKAYGEYCRGDLKVMLHCDCIIFLPGWIQSKGAMVEMNVAAAVGMPMYLYDPPYGLLRFG